MVHDMATTVSIRKPYWKSSRAKSSTARTSRRAASAAAIRKGGFVPPPKISAAAKVDLQILPVPLATLNVATTWIEQDIVAPITAGASYAARVGNQVWVTGVRIKAVITGGQTYPIPVATDDPYNVFRLVLALWQRTTGASAFCSGTALHTPIDPQFSPGIVKVYIDKTICLQSPGASGGGYQKAARMIDLWIPINTKINFTSNVASSNTQQLVLSFLSDSSTNPSPQIDGSVNVYYAP